MKLLVKLYNTTQLRAHIAYIIILVLAAISCNHTTFSTLTNAKRAQLTTNANQQRAAQGLTPLVLSTELSASASKHAKAISAGAAPGDPLGRLVSEGVYARFALSAVVEAPTTEDAYKQLFINPLHAGKMQHNGISHIGFGIARKGNKAVLVVDMARLVDRLDTQNIADQLLTQINARRKRISVAALNSDATLNDAASKLNHQFMSSRGQSGGILVETVRRELSASQMTLGKITISFQTVSVFEDFVLPERTSDPNTRTIGIAVSQGNVAGQDPGALVISIILATPPSTGTNSAASNLPQPRAMPDGHRPSNKASLEEQAWLATLVGNHKKAATLFLKAHRRTKQPQFLYEAARAYARNDQPQAALEKMQRYAELCENTCSRTEQQTAAEMIARLKNGESIFATSKEAQLSVEARRFFILGQKLFSDGEWEGAIDAFSQAYAFAPHPDLIYNIGLAHLKAGQIGDALDFFQEYQRLVPEAQSTEQARQLFEIGVELYNVGQFDAAAKRFTMAYSFLPLEEILYNLALCHQALGEKTEALRIFQELADKTKDKQKKREYKKQIKELQ